jgi:two-component system LytT family response regulator
VNPLRVLVVDDEPLARGLVSGYVATDPELTVVAESEGGESLGRDVERYQPDIVLLDIEMPECDGLEAVRRLRLERAPVFIYVTAYEQYAKEAFEVEALDYVLKPVEEKRLMLALERAKERLRERSSRRIVEQVASLTHAVKGRPKRPAREPEPFLERLPIRAKGRTLVVRTREILWIESQDYYVRVHTAKHQPLLRATLASLESRLDPERFCRVHRRAIVNLDEVRELQDLSKGARAVLLSDGTRLRVARSRRRAVEAALAGGE